MKKIMLMAIALFFSLQAFAAETGRIVDVKVQGMVCDFCAQGIQKTVGKRDEVKNVKVDLDNQLISVQMKPNKNIDDKVLSDLILGNGFSIISINRKECKTQESTEC